MTIKRSLIFTHILVCILPLFMTLFVIISALGGLYLYSQSGNHVMAESDFQFNLESNAIRAAVMHSLRHGKELDDSQWVLNIMDPVQTYVVVYRDGEPFYQYGNEAFQADVADMRQRTVQEELDRGGDQTYSHTRTGRYVLAERNSIKGHVYHLYVMAQKPEVRNDEAIEKAFRTISRFILAVLVFFIVMVSYFLARFITGRILVPLKVLEQGAEEIRQGNLDVLLPCTRNDEFTPALQAFNVMSRKLADSLRQKEADEERRKELIASISHDIRTPLTSVKAYVEGLLDHVADTPERQERYLRVIQKKADVLERLIEQLFLLSKLDLGEKALPLEALDLGEVVREYIDDNQWNWQKKGAAFVLDIKSPVPISGNRLLLERVIENLVTNSIKYKVEDLVHIEVTVETENQQARLVLADDGPGVPDEALARLSEIFYRTDKARSQTDNGSGLGLSIVHRAVALMKGTIDFENQAPHGLKIIITLPLEGNHE